MKENRKQAKKHHYIPRFIMSAWETKGHKGQNGILGYYWENGALEFLHRGLGYFGQRQHLFTLQSLGPTRDALETDFFAKIDNEGARAINKIRSGRTPTSDESVDLAVLFVSLDTRRPRYIDYLRGVGIAQFQKEMEADPEYSRILAEEQITPAELYERSQGHPLEDHFLLAALRTTVDRAVVGRLASSIWRLCEIPLNAGTLLLSDRPVIREKSVETGRLIWALPLSPRQLLIRGDHEEDVDSFASVPWDQMVKTANEFSILQCDRYVFGVPGLDKGWVGTLMEQRAAMNNHDNTLALMATDLARIGYAHDIS